MKSNIVNMADKRMDKEDEMLASLFAAEPVADDGFSDRVLRRLRRGVWVNRLALPVAVLLGLAVAAKPLMDVAGMLPSIAGLLPLPAELQQLHLPDMTTLILGAGALVAGLLVTQLVDD